LTPHKHVAAPKVAFESGGQFIRETRREVEAYLADGRTRRWGYARLYAKTPLALFSGTYKGETGGWASGGGERG